MAQYQQGDVLLTQVSALPSVKRVEVQDGKIVLARGERTGHAHVMDADKVEAYEDADGVLWLRVNETTPLTHEEHGDIAIPAGTYQVDLQREYAPDHTRPDVAPRPVPRAMFD